jgi:hypothetical protein
VLAFRITKKTPKRIYYLRRDFRNDEHLGFVDRASLEQAGPNGIYKDSAAWDDDWHLFPSVEAAQAYMDKSWRAEGTKVTNPADIQALRRAMADAHPDRGGTNEEFIAARERYERALRAVS